MNVTAARAGRAATRGLLLMLALLMLATFLSSLHAALWRADLALYDSALAGGAAPTDVLIVAIDDRSLAALGRWPWRRSLHAQLLQRLRQAGARAVALDVILAEPDLTDLQDDVDLATQLRRGPPTVLPLIVDLSGAGTDAREVLPLPELAHSAAALGHVNLEIDPDGIARSVFLREGPGAPTWPHLMVALLQSIPRAAQVALFGERHPALRDADRRAWVRDYRMLIPFLGPPGHFTQVSYCDVLSGLVGEAALRGKLVLVGATAQGLGDSYPTPLSGYSRAMPGVEISANILQGLRTHTLIRPLPRVAAALLACLPLLLLGVGFHWLTPRQSLLWTAALWLLTLGCCWGALRHAGLWWPPCSALTALALAYPLWSWWRLGTTQRYLEVEFSRLSAEPLPLLGAPPAAPQTPRFGDVIQRRIDLLSQATQNLRELRRLLEATIRGLPDATVVVDPYGRIVLANAAATRLFVTPQTAAVEGEQFDACVRRCEPAPVLKLEQLADPAPRIIELRRGPRAAELLVRAVPFFAQDQHHLGALISLVDISELRAAQREREDVIRFLSHDLKSPASSLLGLAQLQRDASRALPPQELSRRLDLLAARTLDLLDGFIAVAQAESADPAAFSEIDLRDPVQDAVDEVWAAAQARDLQVNVRLPAEPMSVQGNRQLLARAIGNLLNNAVKYASGRAPIHVDCGRNERSVYVSVADGGPGIPDELRPQLFRRFFRGAHSATDAPKGAGLGLAFVRTVAEKHSGTIRFMPVDPQGARFTLSLPPASADPGAWLPEQVL